MCLLTLDLFSLNYLAEECLSQATIFGSSGQRLSFVQAVPEGIRLSYLKLRSKLQF